jgi:hypothetical protein
MAHPTVAIFPLKFIANDYFSYIFFYLSSHFCNNNNKTSQRGSERKQERERERERGLAQERGLKGYFYARETRL